MRPALKAATRPPAELGGTDLSLAIAGYGPVF
jgi:hypothetical protein